MLKGPIRLHMNEMPYLPPREVMAAAQSGLAKLNRYADWEDLEKLRRAVAAYAGVREEHIILSPGSDVLLREVVHTLSSGRKVVLPSPSFFPTLQAAKRFAARLVSIRLSPPRFDLDRDLLMDKLSGPCLVIIDNPNNPTGRMLLDRQAVEAIVERPGVMLLVDEAYYEFSGVTFAHMVHDHPNLAVTRTMDKAFSLAGARIGYAVAGRAFLDALCSFYALLPQPSLYAAIAALSHGGSMRRNVERVVAERERMWRRLDEWQVAVWESAANFLLIKMLIPDAAKKLEELGILVLDLQDQLPPGFVRVSIGSADENDRFIAGYTKIRDAYLS